MDEDNSSFMGEAVDDTDGEMASITSSFSASSPLSSVGSGGGDGRRRTGSAGAAAGTSNNKLAPQNNGNGSYRPSSSNGDSTQAANGGGGAQAIPGVATRPAGVPFGASALSKNMPNSGRGRPRGLRPRGTGTTPRSGGGGGAQRIPSFSGSAASSTQQQFGSTGGSSSSSARRGAPGSANRKDVEARAAGVLAPGVPVEVAVKAAIKIESVIRVLIARGYVRRKLVSEVTAFSLIMERGIEVIKHPFSGKGKPKNVTVNFVSRKGAMQLSWGGKSGVPLETIFGVTKGINTDALKSVVSPDRAENCFSLHTQDRTIDFEVDNPWLVLLVVRALRLFLGAHYDTLPAPTFFSHLCLRPRGAAAGANSRTDSPKQSLVWTSADKEPPVSPLPKEQTTRSTPTERASRDSASDEGDDRDGDGQRPPLPWEGGGGGGGELDSAAGSTMFEAVPMGEGMVYPPAPDGHAPGAGSAARAPRPPRVVAAGEDGEEGMPVTDFADEEDDGHGSADRSPGGIMALFSSGGRRSAEESSVGSAAGSIPRSRSGVEGGGGVDSSTGGTTPRGREAEAGGGPSAGAGGGEGAGQLTASQVLATRGMTKRLNLSKKLAANNTGPLKGRRFDLMALPMDPGQQDRRDRGMSEHAETTTKRSQGMSISIGAGYTLPEEKNRSKGLNGEGADEGTPSMLGLDSGRTAVVDDLNDKLQRRQYQTDMVRQKNQSVEDVHKRDSARTAMLVTRSGVHRVTRKAGMPESR
ncbi:hypothetical protein Esi_0018_0021 [Ectocarpus siliculosus]|uniref:Uncharacterized protein n=1 Tax=Ectocarpus siliculosus TaxID=2880 RepID=D7FNG0_ECTSI|nr:hypothetical protein Esi_0018_0021 [Ectocarpus siliculosus]|eukprot:CBJ25971.1 hypothetical protein Esi_0018_0021 [Ectocarpus siliculosus]